MIDLRGHNWVHFTYRLWCTVTMNSNFASYLKNLKLFSIRAKELSESIVKRERVLALFISIFLKNRSSSDAR